MRSDGGKRPRRIALALAGAVAAGACGPAPAVRRNPDLNVLLVTVDTLRADAVGAYGASGATPWIDRLAAGGARFDAARAHNVMTLPSHANILSGRLPPDHGVRDNGGFRFPAGLATLATLLRARGYRTGAFVSAFPLDSRFGLDAGFDVYDDHFTDAGPRPTFLVQERAARETVGRAKAWIDREAGTRWFAWVHVYEPHFPYHPEPAFARLFQNDAYRGEVAAADAALAPLVAPILEAGGAGRTLVVVTSDHGEALGDHGEATHGVFAYEAVLKVPLVLYQPALFAPTVVTRSAGHVDLLPTVLDALSMPIPEGLAGRSLLPAIAGQPGEEAATYFEALSPSLNRRWAPLYGIVHGALKFIDLPIPELYDLQADPGETRNLAASRAARAGEMRRLLAAARRADRGPQPAAEDVETRQRLRSLGYASAAAASRPSGYTEADDPKRLIAYDTQLHEVIASYLEGDIPAALAICRQLVRQRPETPLWLLHLALLEREAGNLPAGIEALRRAVALAPDDPEALSLLGAYLTEAGRAKEAVELLEPHTRRPDAALEVLTARALALARAGRTADALAALASARKRDPSNAMTLVETGTVHLVAGDRAAAREAFREALAVNSRAARAHSSLGILDAEDGRTDLAREHWKAATAIDPSEHEKIFGLGIALARANRTAEARACLAFFAESAPSSRYRREIEQARLWLKQGGPAQ